MKKILLLLIISSTIFITGCFSYADMNRIYFSTLALVDKEDDNSTSIYGEYFASDRGNSEQGGIVTRIVLKGTGKNVFEGFSNIQGSATYPIRYDMTRAIGFTEDLAKNGIEEIIDIVERDHNVTNKLFLFICDAEPTELMNVEMGDDTFMGIWLEDTFIFQEEQSRIISIRANEYLNERLKGSRISILPIIDIANMPTEDRLYISRAAILKDDKMIGRLEQDEIAIYKILFYKEKKILGAFTVQFPETSAEIVVSLLDLKVNQRIESKDGQLTLVYDIKMVCSINNVIGKLDLVNTNVRKDVIEAIGETISKKCEIFYKKYQDKGIDILDVKLKLDREYPSMDFDDGIFKSVNIEVNPKIILDGSQDITNTLE